MLPVAVVHEMFTPPVVVEMLLAVVVQTIALLYERVFEPVSVAAFEMVMDEPLATAVTVVEAGMPVPVTAKPGTICVKRVGSALVIVVLPDVVCDTMFTEPTELPV